MAQETDKELQGFLTSLNLVKKRKDEVIKFEGRLSVTKNDELRSDILQEAHHSRYTNHPGVSKMYQDMKRSYL